MGQPHLPTVFKTKLRTHRNPPPERLAVVVGARGFEPRTPCAQGRCATRLRYAPTMKNLRTFSTWLKSKAGALLHAMAR
jgi:hypothetical protein